MERGFKKKKYSDEEIAEIRNNLIWYYENSSQEKLVPTTEAFFGPLSEEINDQLKYDNGKRRDVVSSRYLRDIYWEYDKSDEKIIERIEAIKNYFNALKQEKRPQIIDDINIIDSTLLDSSNSQKDDEFSLYNRDIPLRELFSFYYELTNEIESSVSQEKIDKRITERKYLSVNINAKLIKELKNYAISNPLNRAEFGEQFYNEYLLYFDLDKKLYNVGPATAASINLNIKINDQILKIRDLITNNDMKFFRIDMDRDENVRDWYSKFWVLKNLVTSDELYRLKINRYFSETSIKIASHFKYFLFLDYSYSFGFIKKIEYEALLLKYKLRVLENMGHYYEAIHHIIDRKRKVKKYEITYSDSIRIIFKYGINFRANKIRWFLINAQK